MKIPNEQISIICRENGINYLGLFGSHARNEATQDSDLDLLVDFKETKSLFELARIKFSLEQLLSAKVDLVLRNSIKEKLKPYIYNDLKIIYEENN